MAAQRRGGGARSVAAPPPAGQPTAAHRDRLRAVVEPVLAAAGYDLEELTISRVGRRFLVRIAVDSDTGVDLDAVAELSRQISVSLDAAEAAGDELIAGEYELEVGSPGVDRPLTLPRHWRRNAGRLVQVTVDLDELTGRVVSADDESVLLDVDGTRRRVAYSALGPGRVQIEFKRPAGHADDEDFFEDLPDDTELEDEE